MGANSIVTPIAQNQTNQCTITPPWFVQGSEYNVLPGKLELLINGENAFRAVYDAIHEATKSVCIICWGFQPSMFFKRGLEPGMKIGELLEKKAIEGIKVRVLSWKMEVDMAGYPVPLEARVSPTGLAGEANTPGRRAIGVKDKPSTMTSEAYNDNQEWFMRYDKDQGLLYDKGARTMGGLDGKPRTKNIQFVGRGFSATDRAAIATSERADSTTSKTTRAIQAGAASHHQKTVIVDFEDPDKAVAFVMGHNLLDEYWDRSDHSFKRCDDPRQGRNGSRPREDFSSRVKGPLLGDLFHNFNAAWKKETGEDLMQTVSKPAFEKYPLSAAARESDDQETRKQLTDVRKAIDQESARQDATQFDFSETGQKEMAASKVRQKDLKAREQALQAKLDAPRAQAAAIAEDGIAIMGQILRTQPQHGKRDIAKCYLQAVNNATQYIYIENQYFRWPVLADKIKTCATGQTNWRRKPETHGPLYLFVITNADTEGMGAGTVNTARMLESLGRSNALPEVARQQRAEDTEAELKQAKQQSAEEQTIQRGLASTFTRARSSSDRQRTQQQIEESKQKQAAADQRAAALQKKLDEQREDQNDSRRAIASEERPGLKVHIASLVAPDSPGRSGSTASDKERGLTRGERIAKAQNELDDANAKVVDLRLQRNQELMGDMQRPNGAAPSKALAGLDQQIKAEEKRRDDLRQELKALNEGSNPVDWVDVYIHAKLMLIDDTFMTMGSANINSRSMETDSELNITHANHLISQPVRKALWALHTRSPNGKSKCSGGEVMDKEGMKEAYKTWGDVMTGNKDARKKKQAPIASLVEFFSGTKDRSDMD